MNVNRDSVLITILSGTAILCTLIISPWISYDPINLPKMTVLVTGAAILIFPTLLKISLENTLHSLYLYATIFFGLSLIISFFLNDAPWSQQLWGVWGRSTGLLAYLSFLIIMICASTTNSKISIERVRSSFEKLSYFVTFYTLIQAAQLDPINWSQKTLVATLGNINFMSSFLGLATISMICRIVLAKHSISSLLHYGLMCFLNLSLIWVSGSIQGLGMCLVGFSFCLVMKIREKYGLRIASATFASFLTCGLFAFLGTAGVGPLRFLAQETVTFRLDYWKAGLRMSLSNWQHGIGIDSYGDYYQQFRDMQAVLSTGPQRVSNTAHNIFLDVATGSGILSGLSFLILFVSTAVLILTNFKNGIFDELFIALASIWMGFVVFCLISINQIGVGIWGFLFMGFLQSPVFSKRRLKNISESRTSSFSIKARKTNTDMPLQLTKSTILISVVIGVFGFVACLIPNLVDIEMLRATRQQDFSRMIQIAQSPISSVFYKDKLQATLIQVGKDQEALSFALDEIRNNKRNYFSLKVVALSNLARTQDRVDAIKQLRILDPLNGPLMQELDEIEQTATKG